MSHYTMEDGRKAIVDRKFALVRLNGKIPAEKGWPDKPITNMKQFAANLAMDGFPNFGVICGPHSGIFVIDLDVRKPGDDPQKLDGLDWAEHIKQEHGIDLLALETPLLRTGSGGIHIYFAWDDSYYDIPGAAGGVAPGVDIRTKGNQVVAEGSYHPTTGLRYEFMPGKSPEDFDHHYLPVPEPILKIIRERVRDKTEFKPTDKIPFGQQDDYLIHMAGIMIRHNFAYEEVLAALREIGRYRCDPPVKDKDIERIASSHLRYAPGDPLEIIEQTDRGWGMRFGLYGQTGARFLAETEKWAAFDGKRWRQDYKLGAQRTADRMVDTMIARAMQMPGNTDEELERKERALGYALAGRSDRTFTMIMKQGERFSETSFETLDANPVLFNVANGTLNLTTGELQPHSPLDLITKISPVNYRPDAKSQDWDNFLKEVTQGDTSYQEYFQRAVGYSMLGKSDEQLLIIIFGQAATGKSTFLTSIQHVFGDYAETASDGAFGSRKEAGGPKPEIAKFRSARLVTSVELAQGQKLNEALIKTLTGNEKVSTRTLNEKEFTFLPQFTIWFATNDLPEISGSDAMMRRIKPVMFDHVMPKEKRDRDLPERLKSGEHAEAILAWCVEGALMYQRDGLKDHPKVALASDEYREDTDAVGTFLKENYTEEDDAYESRDAMWIAYKAFCNDRGLAYTTNRIFFGEVRNHGYAEARKGSAGHQKRSFLGLKSKAAILSSVPTNGKFFSQDTM